MSTKPVAKITKTIKTNLAEAWDVLTNPIAVKQYFFDTNMETSWEIGSKISFKGVYEGTEYEDKGIVKTFVPLESLSYSYRSSWDTLPDVPENYLLVSYLIKKVDNGIEFTIFQESQNQDQAKHSEESWSNILVEIENMIGE